jgi:hypothetical protein
MKFGIKAYGNWHEFKSERAYRNYLMEWIAGTEGSEQDRAVQALVALDCGQYRYDSDTMEAF